MIALMLINPAFATSGVGIKYAFESADAIQNDITCLKYSVYNPFDSDVTATILAEGDFAEYQFRPKKVDLPANTRSADAKKIDLCFKMPKMVDNCDFPIKLSGNAVATTVDKSNFLSPGSGSRARIAVSAPLNLSVICGTPIGMSLINSIEPNILLGAAVGGGLILLIVLIIFIIKRKTKSEPVPTTKLSPRNEYMNKYSDLMVLHKKISANIASQEEVEKYKSLRSELEDLRNKL